MPSVFSGVGYFPDYHAAGQGACLSNTSHWKTLLLCQFPNPNMAQAVYGAAVCYLLSTMGQSLQGCSTSMAHSHREEDILES